MNVEQGISNDEGFHYQYFSIHDSLFNILRFKNSSHSDNLNAGCPRYFINLTHCKIFRLNAPDIKFYPLKTELHQFHIIGPDLL